MIKDNTITINLLLSLPKKTENKEEKKIRAPPFGLPSPFFSPPPPDFHCISCHNKNTLPSFPSFPHLVSHLQFFFHSLISTVYLATIKIPRPLFPPSPIRSSISNFLYHSLISTVYLVTIKIPRPLFPPSPIPR